MRNRCPWRRCFLQPWGSCACLRLCSLASSLRQVACRCLRPGAQFQLPHTGFCAHSGPATMLQSSGLEVDENGVDVHGANIIRPLAGAPAVAVLPWERSALDPPSRVGWPRRQVGQGDFFTALRVVDLLVFRARSSSSDSRGPAGSWATAFVSTAFIVGAGELDAWRPPAPDGAETDHGVVASSTIGRSKASICGPEHWLLARRVFVFAGVLCVIAIRFKRAKAICVLLRQ
jgi:hypothetical protein